MLREQIQVHVVDEVITEIKDAVRTKNQEWLKRVEAAASRYRSQFPGSPITPNADRDGGSSLD
jgi:hypothetical protein